MNKHLLSGIAATTFVASLAFTAPASAAVTFDPATGTGFVGKGDVQLAFNWSNNQLQSNAAGVSFVTTEETITEVSWECTNTKNENIQERQRITTTSTTSLASHIARDNKKQITGFNLTGDSQLLEESSATEGQPINSCPTNWTVTPAGAPELVSSTASLTVKHGSLGVNLPY